MSFSLSGRTLDESGQEVTPDRVELVGPGDAQSECQVRIGGYVCEEGEPGRAEVVVSAGAKTWRQTVKVRADGSDCHYVSQQLDFELDGLSVCEPRVAVQGALVDRNGRAVTTGTVWLERVDPNTPPPLFARVQCSLRLGRYACPAIGYYGPADYVIGIGGERVNVSLEADDCQVNPLLRDIVLSSAAS